MPPPRLLVFEIECYAPDSLQFIRRIRPVAVARDIVTRKRTIVGDVRKPRVFQVNAHLNHVVLRTEGRAGQEVLKERQFCDAGCSLPRC